MPAGRDAGGRFLPSRETLAKRDVPALIETLSRFGSPVTDQALQALAERLTARLISAPAPDAATLEAEAERIQRGLQRALVQEAQRLRQELMLRGMGLRGTSAARDEMATWIAVGDDATCDSCDDRAEDEPKTMRQWDALGLPGSPNLVCWANCRCELYPTDWIGAEIEDSDEEAA